MIIRALWFSFGAIVSSIVFFFIVYAVGYSLEIMEVSLYSSESDQQRNFNIVLAVWAVIALASGWYLSQKKANKQRQGDA